MPLKKPHELEDGMILADDVFNLDGQILFAKGSQLTPRQIDIMQSWGIPNVSVEGEDDESDRIDFDRFPPSIVEQAEAEIANRFRLVKSQHAAVGIIRKLAVMKRSQEMVREKAPY